MAPNGLLNLYEKVCLMYIPATPIENPHVSPSINLLRYRVPISGISTSPLAVSAEPVKIK